MKSNELKASDLRIGNVVAYDGRIITVGGIHPHCDDFAIIIEGSWVYSKNCRPIPLSEEILVRLGFVFLKHRSEYKIYEHGNIRISIHDLDGVCWCSVYRGTIKVKYIHSLQNIFYALTGEELTLKEI